MNAHDKRHMHIYLTISYVHMHIAHLGDMHFLLLTNGEGSKERMTILRRVMLVVVVVGRGERERACPFSRAKFT